MPADAALDAQVVRLVDEAHHRSETARRPRRDLNRRNWDAYWCKQDWTNKLEGQSRETLPDLPLAVEQICATLQQQLTAASDWFTIDGFQGGTLEPVPGLQIPLSDLMDPDTARLLLTHVLAKLASPGNGPETAYSVQTLLADALKVGLIESEVCLKVYGTDAERTVYRLAPPAPPPDDPEAADYAAPGTPIQQATLRTFQLAIDLIPFEDFFPDPSPLRRYDIHEVTKPLSELKGNPNYDPDTVEAIVAGVQGEESTLDKQRRQGNSQPVDDPTSVRVREYWGDLVDWTTGDVLARNVLVTTCRGRVLRRAPDGTPWLPNPLWHGKRPFVRAPLVRTPIAQTHKAVLDHAVPIAEAQNELFSLMIDSGIRSVWGVGQVHPDLLENPDDITKGIGPAFTAILRRGVPNGQKFYERVDDYQPPANAIEAFNILGNKLLAALAASDIAVGRLPPRQVKATEVVESNQAADTLWGNMAGLYEENVIEPLLELAWLTTWQSLDDFEQPELVAVLGPTRAQVFQTLPPEVRFLLTANDVRFTVRGLRNLQARIKEFQKIMTWMNFLATNPAMAALYEQKFSLLRTMEVAMRGLNLDPTQLERRPDDPTLDPALLAQPGQGPPAATPGNLPPPDLGAGAGEESFAPPNPMGDRGPQLM